MRLWLISSLLCAAAEEASRRGLLMSLVRLVLFIVLAGGLLSLSDLIGKRIAKDDEPAERITKTLLVFFYLITVALTWAVRLDIGFGILFLLAVPGIIVGYARLKNFSAASDTAAKFETGPLHIFFILFIAGSAAALLICGLIFPRYLHDPLTYQLTFPAAWISAGRIHLVPTPFGDPSQAYAPSNPSVFYLFLMGLLRSDFFAAAGQWPFLILALYSAAGISRRIGLKSPYHILPAALMVSAPMIALEARTALSDLCLTAYLLCSIYFLLRSRETGSAGHFLLAAAAAGLMTGTKYNSLPWLPLLIPLIAAAAFRVKNSERRWPAFFILSFFIFLLPCAYWYVRNFILTGSPVYPYIVQVRGVKIFNGAFGREQMLNWEFHRTGSGEWWKGCTEVFTPAVLIIAAATVLVLPALLFFKRRLDWLLCYLLLLPLLMDRINWWVVPFQMERFWVPAAALAAITISCAALLDPRAGLAATVVLAADIILYRGYLILSGPYDLILLIQLILLPVAFFKAAAIHAMSRDFIMKTIRPALAAFAAAVLLVIVIFYFRADDTRRSALLGWEFGPGWTRWLQIHDRPETVAYAGSNVPYPLFGPDFKNRVLYVNVNKHDEWAFHDYDLALRRERPDFKPDTPEPALYRMEMSFADWWGNLAAAHADFLIVTRLGHNQLLNIEHDAAGWPTEDSWARSHPELFTPYRAPGQIDTKFTRIYRVRGQTSK